MRRLTVVALCACGRIGFGPADGDGGGGDGNGPPADAFVRGDVLLTNNLVFVTDPVVVLASLGGLQAADDVCQSEATDAGVPGTFVAWLSTTSTNAIDRLSGSRGWVRLDGVPFVDTTQDLVAGRLLAPLSVDVHGAVLPPLTTVYTGTTSTGTADFNCADLTATDLIAYGFSSSTSVAWTRANASFMACGDSVPIYCFGVGDTRPVTIPPVPSRRAFLSSAWTPGAGIASADALCQADASAAGLAAPATFRALLATSGASAASRFSDGLPWARRDGVAIASTALDVLAGAWDVPPSVRADGTYATDTGSAWVGASTLANVGTDTCSDWSVSNNGASATGVMYNDAPARNVTALACGGARPVICLEQ